MPVQRSYYTLFTSLPALPALFEAKRTPISPERLERRLAMLSQEDAQTLESVIALLLWSKKENQHDEKGMVEQAERIEPLLSPSLREVVRWFINFRTFVSAFRRRKLHLQPPGRHEIWAHGDWTEHILRNWNKPMFGLEHIMPWLTDIHEHLQNGESLSLEKRNLELKWNRLSQAAECHYFDFEAVVFYVLRWHLLARWLRYNGTAALKRFDALVDATIAGVSLEPQAEI